MHTTNFLDKSVSDEDTIGKRTFELSESTEEDDNQNNNNVDFDELLSEYDDEEKNGKYQ